MKKNEKDINTANNNNANVSEIFGEKTFNASTTNDNKIETTNIEVCDSLIARGKIARVYAQSNRSLENSSYNHLITSLKNNEFISEGPPELAEAGDIFVIKLKDKFCFKDLKCDLFGAWGNYTGPRIPKEYPFMKIWYFVHPTSTNPRGNIEEYFKKRLIYFEKDGIYVLHYFGNHLLPQPKPHGNSKKNTSIYNRMLPSAKEKIKKTIIDSKATTSKVVNEICSSYGLNLENIDHPSELIKESKQIDNFKNYINANNRTDRLQNIFSLAEKFQQDNSYLQVYHFWKAYADMADNYFRSFPKMIKLKIAVTDSEDGIMVGWVPKFEQNGTWIPCYNHKVQNLLLKCKELNLDGNKYRTIIYGTSKDSLDGLIDLSLEHYQQRINEITSNEEWDKELLTWFLKNQNDYFVNKMLPT